MTTMRDRSIGSRPTLSTAKIVRTSFGTKSLRVGSASAKKLEELSIEDEKLFTPEAIEVIGKSVDRRVLYDALMTYLMESGADIDGSPPEPIDEVAAERMMELYRDYQKGPFEGKSWEKDKLIFERRLAMIRKPLLPKETMFTCTDASCRSSNIEYTTRQVRGADEGFTTFLACQDCGRKWSIN